MAFISQIFIETTNKCSANCSTCLNRVMKRERGVMPFSLFKKIIDDAVDGRKTEHVHLFGVGEPYLTPSYLDYCDYAIPKLNEAHISSSIITNGRSITEIPEGLTVINISFNAGRKETYERITGLDFRLTLDNIFRVASEGQFARVTEKEIHMLVFDENKDEVDDFIALFSPLKSLGVKLRLAYKFDNQLGRIEDKTLDEFKDAPRVSCHYVENVLTICSNGWVIPCVHDFDGAEVFGDANLHSIDELIEHAARLERLNLHRQGQFQGICEGCNFNISNEGRYVYV